MNRYGFSSAITPKSFEKSVHERSVGHSPELDNNQNKSRLTTEEAFLEDSFGAPTAREHVMVLN